MSFQRILSSKVTKTLAAGAGLVGATVIYLDFIKPPHSSSLTNNYNPLVKTLAKPPARSELLKNLDETKQFDMLIIGGGATGTGTAVDAATRGLNVCLLEKNDFASGTSSKSTKMAHGGVRYLEKAIFQLSKDQLDLVIEALNERGNMLRTAPHLCSVLPIMIPVYKWWQIPYFFVGCKMYDWFAGHQSLRSSTILSKQTTAALAPMMDDSNLKASCVYHDGSFNDARMNSTLAITAIQNGATVLNYMEVNQLLKDSNNQIEGVLATDIETGKQYTIKATSVVNATGPFADKILEMDNDPAGLPPKDPQPPKMIVPSSGVHVVLPEFYGPQNVGLLDPSTSDGRVMFFLPWQGKVLCGTTDTPLKDVPNQPVPTEEEIQDILHELQKYIVFPVDREDVLSAWSGIRPLARNPDLVKDSAQGGAGSTQGLVRSHLVHTSKTGLITISGGKWTTYREMAEETVDTVIKKFKFEGKDLKPCQTNELILAGGEEYSKNYSARLIHEYRIPLKLAKHLSHNYGSRAPIILELYRSSDYNKLPVTLATSTSFEPSETKESESNSLSYQNFDEPFTVAELKYSLQYEYTRHPIDFLARRTRLAFLNARQALSAVDGVVELMKDELKWDDKTTERMRKETKKYIGQMGISPKHFDVEHFVVQ